MTSEIEKLAESLITADQTMACKICGRAWWDDDDTDDPTLFHDWSCPLFGRRDIAQHGFGVHYIEKTIGRELGCENSLDGFRCLAKTYVNLHKQGQQEHYRTLEKLWSLLGDEKTFWAIPEDKRLEWLIERIQELKTYPRA